MTHVKFWDIPAHLNEYLEPYNSIAFDGDKNDKRLHADPCVPWIEMDEDRYNEIEQEVHNFNIKTDHYEVYAWDDISGYDYWMKHMEEPNYIQISIAFNSESIPVNKLGKLKEHIEQAIDWAEQYEMSNTQYEQLMGY